jgi:hypothetical protein
MKTAWRPGVVLTAALWVGYAAAAEPAACPFAGQKPMMAVQMFMGMRMQNGGVVTAEQWDGFLRQTVTPLFPDGLTVYATYGQWRDQKTGALTREPSRVLLINGTDGPELRSHVTQVAEAWKKQFDQQSVGIQTSTACTVF